MRQNLSWATTRIANRHVSVDSLPAKLETLPVNTGLLLSIEQVSVEPTHTGNRSSLTPKAGIAQRVKYIAAVTSRRTVLPWNNELICQPSADADKIAQVLLAASARIRHLHNSESKDPSLSVWLLVAPVPLVPGRLDVVSTAVGREYCAVNRLKDGIASARRITTGQASNNLDEGFVTVLKGLGLAPARHRTNHVDQKSHTKSGDRQDEPSV